MIDHTSRILATFGTAEQRFDYAAMTALARYEDEKATAQAAYDASGADFGDTPEYRTLTARIVAANDAYHAEMTAAQQAYRIEDAQVGMLDWSQTGAGAFDRDARGVQDAMFSMAGELDKTGTPAMF
jgi:hypothetical protein